MRSESRARHTGLCRSTREDSVIHVNRARGLSRLRAARAAMCSSSSSAEKLGFTIVKHCGEVGMPVPEESAAARGGRCRRPRPCGKCTSARLNTQSQLSTPAARARRMLHDRGYGRKITRWAGLAPTRRRVETALKGRDGAALSYAARSRSSAQRQTSIDSARSNHHSHRPRGAPSSRSAARAGERPATEYLTRPKSPFIKKPTLYG